MLGEAYETLEYEGLDGFEAWDFEDEALDEWAFEDVEPDRFLGDVFKKLTRQAARTVGGAVAGRRGASLASMIANQVFREGEFEAEYESEAEFEAEFEAAGGDLELLAEMEYYAELAAEAENEAEAAEFIGAIASLAGPLISSLLGQAEYEEYESYYEDEADPFLGSIVSAASSLLPKVIPFVKRGVQAVGRFLSRPGTRRAIRGIPRLVARTATSLARQSRAGRPINPMQVAATMARHTAGMLGNRRQLARTVRRNQVAARRFRGTRRYPRRRRGRIVRPRYCVL